MADYSGLWVDPSNLGAQSSSEFAYDAAKTASYLLWALSGRKWSGVTTLTEIYRYNDYTGERTFLGPQSLAPAVEPMGSATSLAWVRVSPTRIRLRGTPVREVTEVRAMVRGLTEEPGEVIEPSHYTLNDAATLDFNYNVVTDLSITYKFGTPPPLAGEMAARQLAMEFAMAWDSDENCSLPARVTSISRQGVSYTILDNQAFIDDLKTGVYAVDLFLKTANPDKARARAKVFSPDLRRARRQTPGGGA